jgi:hypothetical protein
MADQLQLRGGTTAQHAAFTGALREVTVDTDKDTLVVHDGAVAGGYPLLRQDLNNLPAGTIVDTKLATISTAGKVSNSATTATNANTASAIVARDGSGNFTAGTITANLTGTASGNARLVRGTAVTSTSGTSIDFTGIPSWAKKITVIFYAVSTTGTSAVQIQLGDSGGVETTGYLGSATAITGTNACGIANYTSGFVLFGSLAGSTRSGLLTIVNVATTVWVASGTFDEASSASAGTTQGYKILSDTLDRVRITTVGGTDTFDTGIINIIYEG